MAKRQQVNMYFDEEASADLVNLQKHFGGIPATHVVRIAVKKLALIELRQSQTTSHVLTKEVA